MNEPVNNRRMVLIVAALGVVYGDIGTSPLYALRECFAGQFALPVSTGNILGILSLIFWTLILLVSVKYIGFVMRFSNQGEGGVLALFALSRPYCSLERWQGRGLLGIGMCGAALLYGDGVITPAITVMSAVEGLNVATTVFEPYVIPISVAILALLFCVQRFGTGLVGAAFGPVMIAWFVVIGVLGLRGIFMEPAVLSALNPWYAFRFLVTHEQVSFVVLGSVFLAVTGAEALYADMGHFGPSPIRRAWFGLVLPCLMLNYLGQGALLLGKAEAATNPFYGLAPVWGHYPLVVLSTLAAVIASQALISGVFSLTMQAVQLGFLPPMAVNHTSSQRRGQIYVPLANWLLMIACIGVITGFGTSGHLAGAYGLAVTMTMLTSTILFCFAARHRWRWPVWQVVVFATVFLTVEVAYCGANFLKIFHGGWFPLALGALIFTIMSTWQSGRQRLHDRLADFHPPLKQFIDRLPSTACQRVTGTAVFLASHPDGTPLALVDNFKHNKVLHERNILLTVVIQEAAHVDDASQVKVEVLSNSFYRVIGYYGFMDRPNVPALLAVCRTHGLEFDASQLTYFLSSETVLAGDHPGMTRWRKWLFAALTRNAQRATAFFQLPPDRVVELGMQVDL
jgi:KUP system potassium uptake protein